MAMPGQASGGWTESSSALRILNVALRNSTDRLAPDGFTQTNPPVVASHVSTRVDTRVSGVMGGSVAFTRYDSGDTFVGGPGSATVLSNAQSSAVGKRSFKALGLFINNAAGRPFENTPAAASGACPYVSGGGVYASRLYETSVISAVSSGGDPNAGDPVTYYNGAELVASRNGYLMSKWNYNHAASALVNCDVWDNSNYAPTAESFVFQTSGSATTIGILKMAPDSVQSELVFNQRI